MIQLEKIECFFVKHGETLNQIVIKRRSGTDADLPDSYEIFMQGAGLLLSKYDTEKLARLLLLMTEE